MYKDYELGRRKRIRYAARTDQFVGLLMSGLSAMRCSQEQGPAIGPQTTFLFLIFLYAGKGTSFTATRICPAYKRKNKKRKLRSLRSLTSSSVLPAARETTFSQSFLMRRRRLWYHICVSQSDCRSAHILWWPQTRNWIRKSAITLIMCAHSAMAD